ncbi:P-loop containing nucleoside triphosphate hydrolase protein [Gorgonomyces haynaldii]|nr:P-loop containing nucleoside triphosphate hydrolase protein [Gorgonomyces haynaldii]
MGDELADETKKLNIKSGGGGGPKFSFKSALGATAFNPGAFEFVPSWQAPAETQPAKSISIGQKKEETKPVKPKEKVETKTEEKPKVEPKKGIVVQEIRDEEPADLSKLGKEHLNIIFMGHVDAGKSTMGGHILFLTGMVDKRTMEKYEREAKELGRESWYLSWALDLNQEERNKGKTTEYGRGYFETDRRRFTIIDAPGHKTFVPSMIEGAAQADIGILVISARKGEFETGFERGGQTREHALLAKTAGVKRLIMVINKMDDPTVGWSEERYNECSSKMLPYLRAVGYGKNEIDIMPISGFTGANMKDRIDPAVCPWYTGPALLELLDSIPIDRKYNGPLLMPIADKLRDMGTIVLGKIESGTVKKGQQVLLMPNKMLTEVSSIMQEENEVQQAFNGDNVRIKLKGVEEEDVMPGFVLCSPKAPIHAVTRFEAQLVIMDYPSIMAAGYSAVLHMHTATEEASIVALLHRIDKKTGKKSKKPPPFMKQGDSTIVLLEVQQRICVETYADYPQLGRFTLRDEGTTVAIGKVTKLIEDE